MSHMQSCHLELTASFPFVSGEKQLVKPCVFGWAGLDDDDAQNYTGGLGISETGGDQKSQWSVAEERTGCSACEKSWGAKSGGRPRHFARTRMLIEIVVVIV